MAFTKLSNADFNDKGALAMPNRPSETMSAQAIKTQFDAPSREVVMPAYNRLIDELEAETGAASIGVVAPTGGSGQTVQALFNNAYNKIANIDGEIVDIVENVTEITDKAIDDVKDITDEAVADVREITEQAVEDVRGISEQGEAWAVGTRGGVPVGPTDETYHNNAKWYAENMNTLDNLTDVNITNPTDGDALVFDASSNKWVNGAADVGLFIQDGILMCRYEA